LGGSSDDLWFRLGKNPADSIAMATQRSFLLKVWTALTASLLMGLLPNWAAAKAPTAKTLLWQISGNGLAKPSYLFGTIHSACSDRLILTAKQRQAVAQSQQLYLEIDLDDLSVLLASTASMRLPMSQSLREVMTAQNYRKVWNYFQREKGIPFGTIANVRPFYLSSMISGRESGCRVDSRENFLIRESKRYKLELRGLETPQERDEVLNSVPMADEVAMLIEAIDNRNLYDDAASRLQKLYDRQDINGLHQFMTNDPKTTDADRRLWTALLDKRNRMWIPEIRRAIAEKPTFFGVGAGHLGGDAGVISLLEAAGYTMTPVFDTPKQRQ
jgi:uncharacterized protein